MIKSQKKSFWQNCNIVTWVSMTLRNSLRLAFVRAFIEIHSIFMLNLQTITKYIEFNSAFLWKLKCPLFQILAASDATLVSGSPPNFSHFWGHMWSKAAWQPIPDIGLPQQHNSPKCWSQKEVNNPMMSMCREQRKGSNSPILMQNWPIQ